MFFFVCLQTSFLHFVRFHLSLIRFFSGKSITGNHRYFPMKIMGPPLVQIQPGSLWFCGSASPISDGSPLREMMKTGGLDWVPLVFRESIQRDMALIQLHQPWQPSGLGDDLCPGPLAWPGTSWGPQKYVCWFINL